MTDDTSVDALLREAAKQLRETHDTGWQRAHERILRGLLVTLRPATPLRGVSTEGPYRLSSAVLTSRLRELLDADEHLRTMRLAFETDDDDALVGITLALSVAYPRVLASAAEAARAAAATAIREGLGEVGLPEVDVVVADVHLLTEPG